MSNGPRIRNEKVDVRKIVHAMVNVQCPRNVVHPMVKSVREDEKDSPQEKKGKVVSASVKGMSV